LVQPLEFKMRNFSIKLDPVFQIPSCRLKSRPIATVRHALVGIATDDNHFNIGVVPDEFRDRFKEHIRPLSRFEPAYVKHAQRGISLRTALFRTGKRCSLYVTHSVWGFDDGPVRTYSERILQVSR